MATAVQIPQGARPQKIGEAQEAFAQRVKMRRAELEGHFSPFTVINFNPVALRLEGMLKRYPVPSPDDDRLPADVQRVSLTWRGRERIGHAMTIREPLLYGGMSGAKSAGGPGEVIPEQEVREMLPIAIAYAFLEHYSPIIATKNDGMVAPPPGSARRMFGVLAFEGDIHTLEPHRLQQSNRIVRMPLAKILSVGRTNRRVYEAVEYSLDKYLDAMFEGQRRYADVVVSRAQTKYTEGKARDEIGSVDRTWYRWAIRMGYTDAPKDPERTWLNELISLTRPDGETPAVELRKCPGCRTVEPEPDTPFCPKCNRPVDTFKTFMAGHHVPEGFLMALAGEERETAMAEYRRRQEGFGAQAGIQAARSAAAAPAAAQRGPGGRFVKATDEIPPADTTQTPGDE